MRRHLRYLVPLTACCLTVAMTTSCKEEQKTESSCTDDVDNDGNGLTDCDDPACADLALCQGPACGDGVLDATEDCDGANLGTGTCLTEGFDGGTLSCNPTTCTYVTSGCTSEVRCGNGILDASEACDGTNLDGETCVSLGHTGGGTLTCGTGCQFVETACEEVCRDLTAEDLTALEEDARVDTENTQWFYYRAVDLGVTNPYRLSIELWNPGDPATTGEVTLGVGDQANYATCNRCVMLYACVDALCSTYSQIFFARSGTIDLTTLGAAAGDPIAGSLTDVSWVEVTIDGAAPYHSTEVPGGDCWNLAGTTTFDATLTE